LLHHHSLAEENQRTVREIVLDKDARYQKDPQATQGAPDDGGVLANLVPNAGPADFPSRGRTLSCARL